MPLIRISDPNDASVYGDLTCSNPCPDYRDVLLGVIVDFTIDSFTSSGDIETLFDLTAPPSFIGPFAVWGQIDTTTNVFNMFLAPSSGDSTYQFATLNNFSVANNAPLNGSGDLFRSNTLPAYIAWAWIS